MTTSLPKTMKGVVLTGHGGLDKLELRNDLPLPELAENEVLIKVGACAVNNTDINTRIGWYSKQVKADTNAGGSDGFDTIDDQDASWSGIPLTFPRIQGADVAGHIVAVGSLVDSSRVGERVMVRAMQQHPHTDESFRCITFGSECDGGFAEYTKALAQEAFTVNSTMSDVELASFPCAFSTAENMVDRANVKAGDVVLVTGASGGVGAAAVQLSKRRGASVIAVCGADKHQQVLEMGADRTIARGDCLIESLGTMAVDVVLDLVAGEQWPELPEVLRRGGRYAVAGAIGGPLTELDVRTLYLKDLSFFGCTYQQRHVFENLVSYIEAGEIKPVVSNTYPLEQIHQAQEDFLAKKFVGKLVLVPEH
ncbi:alcohol dehydrogenase [Photobacterium gaetbulicola]|uniref:Alcohol dehydrogenase n=1 Tax=Photobacterium gaetbulicola TaxID=1295392 RepID=A0A0B9FZU5_9GAMM|nr:alcohol dehydrogenase family protein [Photobacterium gaetbulicola]KHT62038.1 alcohol dehydrogenase [Photobacterium gaetbulicola]